MVAMGKERRELIVYPGSFIWRRIDDEWIVSKSASLFFALSVFFIVGMTVVIFANIESRTLGSMGNTLLGIGGVSAALGVFFLWGGMWRHWIRYNFSSLAARRIWFLALVVGVWYGAILYYALVYLPSTRGSQVTPTRTLEK
jgi:hypothetical protein